MQRHIAYRGGVLTIAYALERSGHSPGAEFFNGLGDIDQGKVLTLFRYLGDIGRISNPEKFGKLQDNIWEFKSFQIRILCSFGSNRTVLITHGFMKKQQKTPPEEIIRAKRILEEDAQRCTDEHHARLRRLKCKR